MRIIQKGAFRLALSFENSPLSCNASSDIVLSHMRSKNLGLHMTVP